MPTVHKQSVTKPLPAKKKAPGSVLSQMANAWDFVDRLRILLYGRSATGKTTVWGTFPGPILCIVCSGGIKPGELKSLNTPTLRAKVTPVVLMDTSQFIPLLEEQAGNFETVVLDHVSGLQDLMLKEILNLSEIPAQKSWGLASQQDYGQCTLKCKELLRRMLAIDDANVVIIGQERENEGKEGSEIISPNVGVATTPSLAGWLNPACDYICQTFIRGKTVAQTTNVGGKAVTIQARGKGVEYCLRTAPHDVFTTKFRIPKGSSLPEVIVDPDYNKILAAVQGKFNPKSQGR